MKNTCLKKIQIETKISFIPSFSKRGKKRKVFFKEETIISIEEENNYIPPLAKGG